MRGLKASLLLAASALLSVGTAHAFQFDAGPVKGNLDSTITTGFGWRLQEPDSDLNGDPGRGGSASGTKHWSNGDNGNLNYDKHDLYSAYVKGTHELLLTFPAEFKFMARGTWLNDFAADNTDRTPLEGPAEVQVARDIRLLDLWASKQFSIGGQSARIRLGNQVVSWGESLFTPGGINSTNALDIQKLLVPGTQLKEAVIPAPILSVASGLGAGFNVEAYYQFAWNRSRLPPSGTYWSSADMVGKGADYLYISTDNPNFGGVDAGYVARKEGISFEQARRALILTFDPVTGDPSFLGGLQAKYHTFAIPLGDEKEARNDGQYGVAIHYKPRGVNLDLGFYFMNYHDKLPVLENENFQPRLRYLENRKLYGVSANFPVGNWAVGWELSYRPKDAIALTGCFNPGGPFDAGGNAAPAANCQQWIDTEKYQTALTGILSLTPGDHGWFLHLLGADTATVLAEAVGIRYVGVSPDKKYTRTVDGVKVVQGPSANLNFWQNTDSGIPGYPVTGAQGTEYSGGYVVDFSWVYDGKLIPGWQVQPGITFSHSVFGDTPNSGSTFLHGNKSANFYVLFNKNPATWQAGINYTAFFGDKIRQPYGDRDFLGGFVSYNF